MPAPPITPLPPAPSRGDDPQNFSDKADAWVAALPQFGADLSDVANYADGRATDAEDAAVAAGNSANSAGISAGDAANSASEAEGHADDAEAARDAILNGNNTVSTSTTSHSFSADSKLFTVQSGKGYAPGQFVIVARTSVPASYMYGQVTAYSGTDLTVNVTIVNGVGGPFTDWTISGAPPIFQSPVLSLSDAEIRYLFGG